MQTAVTSSLCVREGQSQHQSHSLVIMVTPVKKVPIHLQSAQNRLIIKNGTVVNCDKEEQVDIYIEVSPTIYFVFVHRGANITFLWLVKLSIFVTQKQTVLTITSGMLLSRASSRHK